MEKLNRCSNCDLYDSYANGCSSYGYCEDQVTELCEKSIERAMSYIIEEICNTMYHYCFEDDNDMQKWNSGCWLRYKLFENVIEEVKTRHNITQKIDTMDYKEVLKHVIKGDYVRVDEYIVESVNKQIAKKAKRKLYTYTCPICETVISNNMNYCPNCGQHIII